MTKTMLTTEEDRDMWKRLFEDCNKKQGQELERLRQDYKQRSEQMALKTPWRRRYLQGVILVGSPRWSS